MSKIIINFTESGGILDTGGLDLKVVFALLNYFSEQVEKEIAKNELNKIISMEGGNKNA